MRMQLLVIFFCYNNFVDQIRLMVTWACQVSPAEIVTNVKLQERLRQ